MPDIKDLIKGEVDKAKDDLENIVGGLFTKKVKYTENEDGSISREVKVGKQKLKTTAVKGTNDTYIISEMASLDDKNKQKIVEKINEGKKLSKDEQLWTNYHDRMSVSLALKGMEYDDETASAHLPYTKEQLIGKQEVGAFFVNTQGFEGDKTAFLAGVKQQMIAVYGTEAGEKHFNDFVAMSGLNDELQKLADKEKAAEAQKEEPSKVEPIQTEQAKESPLPEQARVDQPTVNQPAVEVPAPVVTNEERDSLRESMKADATAEKPQAVVTEQKQAPQRVTIKDEMKNDGKVAATRDLLGRRGVKLADKEATLNKLVENFGAEAAYEIALKCLIEPKNAMSAMGEGFKRSGGALEYFAAIDPKDAAKMAKVAELAGVSLKPVNNEPKRDMPPLTMTRGTSPASIADAKVGSHIPDKLEPVNYVAEQKYAEMCKKMNKDTLTVEDLTKMGANRQDFDVALKKMLGKENVTSENIQSKVEKGFGLDGASPVSKDFALEVIGRVEDRKLLAQRARGNTH